MVLGRDSNTHFHRMTSDLALDTTSQNFKVRDQYTLFNLQTGESIPLYFENMLAEFSDYCTKAAIDYCKKTNVILEKEHLCVKINDRA